MVTVHACARDRPLAQYHPLSMLLRSTNDDDGDDNANNHIYDGNGLRGSRLLLSRHLANGPPVDFQQHQQQQQQLSQQNSLGFDASVLENYQYAFGGGGGSSSNNINNNINSASHSKTVKQQGVSTQKPTRPARPGQTANMAVFADTPSSSEGQKNNKRRRRDSSPSENSSTNPPDESSVINRVPPGKERRRTQMRLAQRAYRQRKQNELSTTHKRLSEIGDAVTDLGTAYNSLSSMLTTSGFLPLWPDLAQNLEETTGKFQALAQLSSLSENDSDQKSSESPPPLPAQALSTTTSSSQDNLGMLLPPSTYAGSSSPCQEAGFVVPKVEDDTTTAAFNMTSSNLLFYPQTMPPYEPQVTLATNTSGVPVPNNNIPQLPTPTYLTPPTSYSYQETTFARRLQRKCVESAYRVLISDRVHPAKKARIFKLVFRIWNKRHLTEKFRESALGWEVDDPATPYFSVGGAGTHYPRTWNQLVQPVTNGPWPTHIAHIQHQGPDKSVEAIVHALGMDDGDWFDCLDIEGHLRGMGVYLEGHTTYAEFMQGNVPAVLNVDQFLDRMMSKAVCLGRSPGFRKRDVEQEFFRSVES